MKFSLNILLSCMAASITANPMAIYDRALESRAVTVSATDLTNFKLFVQYTAAAYCTINNNSTGTPLICSGACPLVESAGAYSTLEFSYNDATDSTGFLAIDPKNKLIVVSFRGSNSIRNWVTDILFIRSGADSICADCSVHTGFLNSWNVASAAILSGVASAHASFPSYKIVATGHSLGAAIATVGAAVLRNAGYTVSLYTYGSPRVGNDDFANYVTAQGSNYRITHVDDPVPRLPPLLLGYHHTSPEYWLSTGTATTVDYTLADIKTCEGISNTSCNAGTSGSDTTAHSYYFQRVSLCAPDLELRDDEGAFGENTENLEKFMVLDNAYYSQMESAGLLDE